MQKAEHQQPADRHDVNYEGDTPAPTSIHASEPTYFLRLKHSARDDRLAILLVKSCGPKYNFFLCHMCSEKSLEQFTSNLRKV